MNNHELVKALPEVIIGAEDVSERLEKEQQALKNAKSFVNSLSINHYLPNKLIDFDIESVINVFEVLNGYGFTIDLNKFSFVEDDSEIGRFACDFDYQFSKKFIQTLIKDSRDLTDEENLIVDGVEVTYGEVFACNLVFSRYDLDMGDTPSVMLILIVQKAMIAMFCTSINIEKLKMAKGDVSIIEALAILQ